jgi:hypothetical protein
MAFDINRLRTDQLQRLLEVGLDVNQLRTEELEDMLRSQEEVGDFGAGLSSLGAAAKLGFAGITGDKRLAESAQRTFEEIQLRRQPEVPSIIEAFEEEGLGAVGDIPTYLYEQLLFSAPQMAAQLGAGAIATRFGGPRAGMAAATAAGAPAFAGYNIQRQIEEQGIGIEDAQVAKAFAVGTGQAALDALLGRTIGVFGRTKGAEEIAKAAQRGMATRIARKAGEGAALEAVTESGQQALEILQANPEKFFEFGPEVQRELAESAIAGGLLGGTIAAPAGIARPRDIDADRQKDLEAHMQEEAEETLRMEEEAARFEQEQKLLEKRSFDLPERSPIFEKPRAPEVLEGEVLPPETPAESREVVSLPTQVIEQEPLAQRRRPEDGEGPPLPALPRGTGAIYVPPTAKQRGTLAGRLAGLTEVVEGVEQPSTARAEEAFRERIRAGMANPFNDQEAAKLLEKLNQLELEGKRKAAQNARKRLEERLGGLGVNPEQTADLLAATPSQREQLKMFSQRAGAQAALDTRETAKKAYDSVTTSQFNQATERVRKTLQRELRRLGLGDVALRMDNVIRPEPGTLAEGVTEQTAAGKVIIALSSKIYSPDMTDAQLKAKLGEVMNHEMIHAMKTLGLFTDAEYQSLVNAAREQKFVDKTGKERLFSYFDRAEKLYKNDSPEIKQEEAVAELFRDWAAGRRTIGGKPPTLFQKIIKFIKTLGGLLNKEGFDDPSKIFEAIQAGEIGRRERGPVGEQMQMYSRKATADSPAFYSVTERQIEQLIGRYSYPLGTTGYAVRMPIEDFMSLTFSMGKIDKKNVITTAKEFLKNMPSNDGSVFTIDEDNNQYAAFDPEIVDSQNYMGVPFIDLEIDEEFGTIRAVGHEGRHRTSIAAIDGAETIPVQVRFKQFYTNYDTDRLFGNIPRDQRFNYYEFAKKREVEAQFKDYSPSARAKDSITYEVEIPAGVPIDYSFKEDLNRVIGPKSDPLGIAEESGTPSGTQRFSRRAMANPYNVNIDETIVPIYPGTENALNRKQGSVKKEVFVREMLERSGLTGLIPYNEDTQEQVARKMATEALMALEFDNNAIGWYDEKLRQAKNVLYLIEPSVFDSPENELAFDYALAVTSNGTAVMQNFPYALSAYRYWLKNNRFPVEDFTVGGDRIKDMKKSFRFYNEYQNLYNTGQIDTPLSEFLDNQYRVRDLNKVLRGLRDKYDIKISIPSGEGADALVRGSLILGPKIGQGFYQNLRGNYNELTSDMWWMRMWNRMVGNPFKPRPSEEVMKERRQRMRDQIRNPVGSLEATIIEEAIQRSGLNRSDIKSNANLDELAVAIFSRWNSYFRKFKKEQGVNPDKPKFFQFVDTYVDGLSDQLQGTPRGPAERQFMRDTTERARELLRQEGVNIYNADFQALLWYPEKRLWLSGGVAPGQGSDSDYADAAIEAARKEGVSNDRIQEALADTRPRGIAADRRAGPPDAGVDQGADRTEASAERFSRRAPATSKIIELIKNDAEGFTESIDGTPIPAEGFVVAPVKESELILEGNRVSEDKINALVLFAMDLSQKSGLPVYVGGWLDSETNKYYIDAVIIRQEKAEALYMASSAEQEAIWDLGANNEIRTEQGLEDLKKAGLYDRGGDNVFRGRQIQYRKYFDTFRGRYREELLTSDGRTLERTDRGEGTGLAKGVALSNYPEYARGDGPESGRSEFYGVHYSSTPNIESLDSNKHGTGRTGREIFRGWRPRVFFYRQKDPNLPRPELKLENLKEGYGARLTNIYDPRKDDFLVQKAKDQGVFNLDAFEDLIEQSGYDGYIDYGFGQDGTHADAFVLLGEHSVPVVPVMTNKKLILNSSIDPATKRPMYSRRYSATAPSGQFNLDDMVDRLVSKEPETSPIMKIWDKFFLGRLEGETRWQAFTRNAVNRFLPGYLLDNYVNGEIADPANSVGRAMELSQSMTGRLWALAELGAMKFNPDTGTAEVIEAPDNIALRRIFEPIGEKYMRQFFAYAIAKRELKLGEQGRKGFKNLKKQDAVKIISESEAKYPFFREVHNNYALFNRRMVQMAVDSGLITKDQGDNFMNMDYVPYYRYAESATDPSEFSKAMAAKAHQSLKDPNVFEKELEGGTIPLGDMYENITKNAGLIVSASLKNYAMQKTADALDKASAMDGPKSWGRKAKEGETGQMITFYRNGEKVLYKIDDPALWTAVAGLTAKQKESFVKGLEMVGGILRAGVTIPPGFQLANLWRGKIDAYVKTGIPVYRFDQTVKAMRDVYANDKDTQRFKIITGMGGYLYGADAESLANTLKRGYRLKEPGGPIMQQIGDRLRQAYTALEKTGEASEMAERIVIMRKLMAEGVSEREAAFQGLNLINFGRRGAGGSPVMSYLVNFLIPTVTFLNARIQGLARLIEDPNTPGTVKAEAFKEIFARGMLVTAGSVTLGLLAMQDDRWEDESVIEKVTNDIIYIGDVKIRIPKAFEIGALFGTIPVMTLDAIRQERANDLAQAVGHIFVSTFSFSPVPQGLLPVLEVIGNYDSFRAAPIEGISLQRLPTELRAYESTPEIYKLLSRNGGSFIRLSPLEIQQLIEGYLGTMATNVIATTDTLLSATGAIPEKPSGVFGNPFVSSTASILGLNRFVREDGAGASRFVSEFYEMRRDLDQTYTAMRDAAERGQTERVNELMQEKGKALSYRTYFNNVARQLSEVNKAIDTVRFSQMDSDAKKERLKELRKTKVRLTQQIVTSARSSGYFD